MYDDFISHFDEALPVLLFYDHKPKDVQKELTKRIDEFYFKGKRNWSKADHHNLTNVNIISILTLFSTFKFQWFQLFTDNWFIWGQDKFLRHRFTAAKKGKVGATYAYLFDHRGPKSMTEDFHGLEEYYGTILPFQYISIKRSCVCNCFFRSLSHGRAALLVLL